MTDKVQKIKEWIQTRKLCTMDEHMKFYCKEAESDYNLLCSLEKFLDSMQEEPVREELEEAAKENAKMERSDDIEVGYDINRFGGFVDGANWQKKQIMKEAVNGEIQFGTIKVQKEDIKEAVKSLREGDKVKLMVIKKD